MSIFQIIKVVLAFAIFGPFVFILGPIFDSMKPWYRARPTWQKYIMIVPLWIIGMPVYIGQEIFTNLGMYSD